MIIVAISGADDCYYVDVTGEDSSSMVLSVSTDQSQLSAGSSASPTDTVQSVLHVH